MPQSDQTSSLEGTIVGGTYRVGKCIGQGAMGAVFEAEHLRLAGRYAIKVLQPDIAAHPEVLSRFQREATITSQLRHPNIVSVLDFNVTPDGRPFLAMELLDGVEVTDAIKQAGPMPLARVLDIVGQVVSALSAAHALGIVHRDLKPQNLFLVRLPGDERQVVKVLDFGISKVHEATTRLTQAHAVIGTPQYMAPEQALGQSDLDHRVDQFALGAITYELLTGRTPFRGDSIPSVLYQVVHEHPSSIRSFNPEISAAVEAVVLRAMAKKPGDRYPGIRDFHAALTQAEPARSKDKGSSTAEVATTVARSTGGPAVVETRKTGAETTFSTAAAELGSETLAPLRSHRTRMAVAGAAVSVVLVGIGWLALRTRAPEPAPALPRPPVEVAPPVVVKPPALPPAPVNLHNPPPGLTVTVDGQPASLPLTLARGPRQYTLRFAARDRGAQQIVVDGNQPAHEIQLDLPPVKPKTEAKTPPVPLKRDLEPQTPVQPPPRKPAARNRIITDF